MHTIYSLGYLSSTPDDVKAYVDTLGARLVDIRFSPRSRNPNWTMAALIRLVGADRYLHEQRLGNVNYRNGGPIRLWQPEAALPAMRAELADHPVILLCACREWQPCHRRVAADFLSQQLGAPVEHLPGRIAERKA